MSLIRTLCIVIAVNAKLEIITLTRWRIKPRLAHSSMKQSIYDHKAIYYTYQASAIFYGWFKLQHFLPTTPALC